MRRLNFFKRTTLGNKLRNLKIKRLLVANGSSKERNEFQEWKMLGSKHTWWVKGYTQKEGVDFNEVFSPVVKHSSIRVLLAMVTLFDLELE